MAKNVDYIPFQGRGQDSIDVRGIFQTHAVDRHFPEEGVPLYNVSVNGSYVGLYNDRNHWGGLVHFGYFEFENGREVTIRISYYQPFETFEILPIKRLNLLGVKRISKSCIEIRMDQANQNVTVIINGEAKKHVLHLFCNSIDHNAPEVAVKCGFYKDEAQKIYYFGPGYHDFKQLFGDYMLPVPDGWRVYLAAGAVAYGHIGLWGTHKGTKVYGRGMIYNDTHNGRVIFETNSCEGADVEGVLFHCHRPGIWQVVLSHSKNVEFKNVKVLSTRYASTDGIDIVNCQQCTLLNTFIRSNDDAIAIKGLDDKITSECAPTRNLTFCGLQIWNDCNCALGIGAENHCSIYENIEFLNSSILFSYDDPDYHEVLDERAAMTICCLHGTFFRNIKYQNIDVYHGERLIAMGFQPHFWFGTLPGDQSTPGGISNITFKDIRVFSSSGSKIANKIHLYGWKKGDGTPDKYVENVRFDNVQIEGRKLLSPDDSHFSETDWTTVRNVTFH